MGVAKHREQRHAVAVVDRVVAPHAAGNVPAVEAEKLVEFVAGEIQRPVLRPIIRERQHRRTFSGSSLPIAVCRCHAVFTISMVASSLMPVIGWDGLRGRPVCFRSDERLW